MLTILCLLYAIGLPDGHAPGTLGAQHFECQHDTTGDGLADLSNDVTGADGLYDDARMMAAIARYNAAYGDAPGTSAIHDPE